ncbi:MAG: hypothetical protein K0U37_03835 [Gammaproteobacteria bacterium]|nr:hypothetical protein [Gammaproteobacteria bacterium]
MKNQKICFVFLAGMCLSGALFADAGTLYSITVQLKGSNNIQTAAALGNSKPNVVFETTLRNHTDIPRILELVPVSGVAPLSNPLSSRSCVSGQALGAGASCDLGVRVTPNVFLKGQTFRSSSLTVCAADTAGNLSPFLCSQTPASDALSVSVTKASSPPLITTGSYSSSDAVWDYPLVGVSHDLGVSWATPESIEPTLTSPTPEFNGDPAVNFPMCSEDACIASGHYRTSYTSGGGSVPYKTFLLSVSTDQGVTWSYPSDVTNPTSLDPSFGFVDVPLIGLQQGTCVGSTCIVPGFYIDTDSIGRNVVVVGTLNDGNWTWTFPTDITKPTHVTPNFSSGEGLLSTAFSPSTGNYMAVGTYVSSSNTIQPFLGVSSNLNTWSTPESFTNPQGLSPAYSNFGPMRSISCSQGSSNYCIAVGHYYDTQVSPVQTPVAAVNSDTSEWRFPDTFTQPVTSPNVITIEGGAYTSAYCDQATCAIVGSYIRDGQEGGGFGPLLGFTSNTGQSWTFPSEIAGSSSGAAFNNVTVMNDTTIIAVGYFLDPNNLQQLMILRGTLDSQGRAQWAFLTGGESLKGLPDNYNNGSFSSVYCLAENKTCIAAGTYQDSNSKQYPALFVSQDAGLTWNFSNTMANPDVTPSFSNGQLLGAGGG